MSYEVLYNSCYGGYDLPSSFVEEVFQRFPPESEEGKQLWTPTHDRFIQENEPVPLGIYTNRVLKSEEFCHGYKWIYYERLDKNGERKSYQSHDVRRSHYCTKDFKIYYYVKRDYTDAWRTLPGLIEMAVDIKSRNSEIRIARVPNNYSFYIHEYDGKESVEAICPTHTIIENLLKVIHTGSRENLHVLTEKLLNHIPVKEVLYPVVED